MRQNEPRLVFEPMPSSDLEEFLKEHIIAYNVAASGEPDYHPVGYFYRNQRGEILGGCIGYVWAKWLHVQWLWVSQAQRGRGMGERLLLAAEALAAEHAAVGATLETHNPIAYRFYLGRGYELVGKIDDYPPGAAKYFLKKTLRGHPGISGFPVDGP